MKQFLIIILAILSQPSHAQNIVSNSDFEQYTLCPTNLGMIQYCTGWKTLTDGTPDYFNECSTTSVDVPYNFRGYQYAQSGAGYAGLYALIIDYDSREYLGTTITPLEVNAQYRVSMDLSLANLSGWGLAGMGVFFYVDTVGVDLNTTATLNLLPQADFINAGIISDTANWIHVADTFIADSAYKNIIIGLFRDTSQMPRVQLSTDPSAQYTYFYIDNVVIEKIVETAGITNIQVLQPSVYPNPFTQFATIRFSNPLHEKYTLSIYNIQGRLLRKIEDITTGEIKIERNDLSSGSYFYELKSEDGAVAKGKLFVQ